MAAGDEGRAEEGRDTKAKRLSTEGCFYSCRNRNVTSSLRKKTHLARASLKDPVKDTLSLGFGVKDTVEDAPRSGFA